jgi:hypothetical protein
VVAGEGVLAAGGGDKDAAALSVEAEHNAGQPEGGELELGRRGGEHGAAEAEEQLDDRPVGGRQQEPRGVAGLLLGVGLVTTPVSLE